MSDTSDVYVNRDMDAESYFEGLREDIRKHVCTPFEVVAQVMPPGFPDVGVGTTLSGICVAFARGYWLVYNADQDRFYCFWGTQKNSLGAHGVYGSPLACWSS